VTYDPRLRVTGSGPPLVLVPGLDGTGQLFYRQVDALAQRHRAATFRLRDAASDMQTLVADVHDIVERLNREAGNGAGDAVTIVGESFGGALALSYALTHPRRVGRLVVLNSFTPPARLWLAYHLLRATPWRLMRVLRRFSAWRLQSPQTERGEREKFHELMRATTREGYLSRLSILRQYDVRSRLPDLQVPTLFLAADRDHLLPAVPHARQMASLVPRASMRVLSGHGHTCLLAPDLNLAAILDEWSRG
jgi:pimeloyl-ACP methyl ester carboxylesterase